MFFHASKWTLKNNRIRTNIIFNYLENFDRAAVLMMGDMRLVYTDDFPPTAVWSWSDGGIRAE